MAVSPNVLYSLMRSIIASRASREITTNPRILRGILEFGRYSEMGYTDPNHLCSSFVHSRKSLLTEPEGETGSCWINPAGSIFTVPFTGHSNFARLLTGVADTSILEKAGWVHVSDRRIDILATPTLRQQAAIDYLVACPRNFRVEDMRRVGVVPALGEHPDGLDRRLTALSPMTTLDWEGARFWEMRGIPRVAHSVREQPVQHIQDMMIEVEGRYLRDRSGPLTHAFAAAYYSARATRDADDIIPLNAKAEEYLA